MDESVRRLLAIRKKTSWLYDLFYELRKSLSVKSMIVSTIVFLFFFAIILFANIELANRPDILAELKELGMSKYVMALYWLVTTITTVGYGDIVPITLEGRLLAIFVMILGMLSMSLIISQITSRIVSVNLGSMFGFTKTKKKIDCIFCGWNSISESSFREIKKNGLEVVVIDPKNRPELAKSKELHYIIGDPTNPAILRRANITNAKNIVLTMNDDSDILLAVHVVREINPWINIVAKINNHEHIKIVESAGADHVVSPASISGRLLSMVSDEPSAVDWILRVTAKDEGVQLVEYDVTKDSPFVDKTIRDVRKEFIGRAKIIGIDTAEGFEKIPGDDIKIEAGNKLLMIIDRRRLTI